MAGRLSPLIPRVARLVASLAEALHMPTSRVDPPRRQAVEHHARWAARPHIMDFGLAKRDAGEITIPWTARCWARRPT